MLYISILIIQNFLFFLSLLFSEDSIYIVGDNQNNRASLWKVDMNGVVVSEMELSNSTSYATDVKTSKDGKVFVTGADSGPVLWIVYPDRTLNTIPLETDSVDNAQALALSKDGLSVYVVGYNTLWKVTNEKNQSHVLLPETSSEKNDLPRGGHRIVIGKDQKVYILGNNNKDGSTLWTQNQDQTFTTHTLPNSGGLRSGGLVGSYRYNPAITTINYGMYIDSSDRIYMVGTTGGDEPAAALWIKEPENNHILFSQLEFHDENQAGVASSITLSQDGVIHIGGTSFLGKTNLWRIYPDGTIDSTPLKNVGFINDMSASSDNLIYSVGQTRNKGGYYGHGYTFLGRGESKYGIHDITFPGYGSLKLRSGPAVPAIESPLTIYNPQTNVVYRTSIPNAQNFNAIAIFESVTSSETRPPFYNVKILNQSFNRFTPLKKLR